MTTRSRRNLRVLIGPTSLAEIAQIRWASAEVRHLVRDLQRVDAATIRYDIASLKQAIAGKPIESQLAELIIGLNQDVNCLFLAERERGEFFNGSFLASVALSNCARFAWSVLDDHRPELVIFHNHPHELFTYVLLKLSLHRNIATFLVHFSALPWRSSISRYDAAGLTTKLKLRTAWSDLERDSVERYMSRLQASHESAIPHGDRALISSQRRSFYIGDELRSLLHGSIIKNLLRLARKWSVYRAFQRTVSDAKPKSYVTFLMHYQPEETTMPRGGVFAQQLNAILLLRAALPDSVAIVVKENKATFRAPLVLSMAVRSQDFYAALSSLPNTWLVPLERDTFELIDNSLAVATITGSVGLEALCRGKPVLVFGDANYENFSGVTRLGWNNTDVAALNRIVEGTMHDRANTRHDLLVELLLSIGPALEKNEINADSQRLATVEAFEYIGAHLNELIGLDTVDESVALP
jgi:hypothetical protein